MWRAKCLAGVVLVVAQVAVLAGLTAAANLFPNWEQAAATLIGMAGAALFGLAWGMLFSSVGRSVMNMILVSLAGAAGGGVPLRRTGRLPERAGRPSSSTFRGDPHELAPGLAVAGFSIPVAPGASALVFTAGSRPAASHAPQPSSAARAAPATWAAVLAGVAAIPPFHRGIGSLSRCCWAC